MNAFRSISNSNIRFWSQMSIKDIEIVYLSKQNADSMKMYEEMRSKLLDLANDVRVYNNLILPEVAKLRK